MSGFTGYEGMQLFLPFLIDVQSQGKVSTTNPEFYVRQPMLEPRVHSIYNDIVNINVSRFIYIQKYEPHPKFSQRQAIQRKYWLVKGKEGNEKIVELPEVI